MSKTTEKIDSVIPCIITKKLKNDMKNITREKSYHYIPLLLKYVQLLIEKVTESEKRCKCQSEKPIQDGGWVIH